MPVKRHRGEPGHTRAHGHTDVPHNHPSEDTGRRSFRKQGAALAALNADGPRVFTSLGWQPMPPSGVNYAKWDNIEDSDDDEPQPSRGRILPKHHTQQEHDRNETRTASVTAGFIIKTTAHVQHAQLGTADAPAYINVCSSTAVEGKMSATLGGPLSLDATLPYIVGDPRQDEDRDGNDCVVVECMFHPDTLAAYELDKRSAETIITTALNVVSELAFPVDKDKGSWSLFEPDALRETTGRYFFPPGKLKVASKVASGDDDLSGVE